MTPQEKVNAKFDAYLQGGMEAVKELKNELTERQKRFFTSSHDFEFRDFDLETKKLNHFNIDKYDRYESDCFGNMTRFFGLKDINLQKIYEGDFCKAKFKTKYGVSEIFGVVIFDEYMYCLDCGEDVYSINRLHEFEVVGNIFENPELEAQLTA